MAKMLSGDEEMTYVMVTLVCARCRKPLGEVYRYAGQHPQAGREVMQGRCGTLVDRPDGGRTLHSVCKCGAKPQTRWERVADRLNGLHHDAPTLDGRVGVLSV